MMADCIQYNSDYVSSVDVNSISLDIDFIEDIISQDNIDYVGSANSSPTKVTGVWYPIVITSKENEAKYCDLLQKSKETNKDFDKYYSITYGKDKCQSSDVGSFNILDISDNLVASKSRFFDGEDVEYIYNALDCSYCGYAGTEWRLIDDQGNQSPQSYTADCCGGACDVRMNENDYIPKIPLLNYHYYNEPCDFPYIKDNPARSGPGLGKEKAITITKVPGLTFGGDIEFYIDWKLKETISEIPYDQDTTQHSNKNLHDKSYKKSKIISRTCGNFLLTSVNQATKWPDYDYSWLEDNIDVIPEPESFTAPYGIRSPTIDNIFVGSEKVGSFWKWNYTSGILGWYRKYDVNRSNDERPIPGIDLYIANGDVFFATNAKIEPDPPLDEEEGEEGADLPFIKACPSGLKIVQNGSDFKGIIPNESSFMYISANIYDLFYEWHERYQAAGHSLSESRRLAAIMATAPQFENVTTDLLDPILGSKNSSAYTLDSLRQIKVLSENLQTGTNYDSARINYVANTKDLFGVLEYKYGAYLGIEKNSTITFDSPVDNNFVLDLNFDFVTTQSANNPSYTQTIKAGTTELLSAAGSSLSLNGITYTSDSSYRLYDVYPRIVDAGNFDGEYCDDCDAYSSFYLTDKGEAACTPDGDASFCYETLAFFLNNSQGEEEGTRPLRNISDATIRESRTVIFNHPYIDTFAINSKNSMYVSSAIYNVPIGITHPNSQGCPRNSKLSLGFNVDRNSMIKLYWSTLKQVQNEKCVSNERFPLDLNNTCICYPDNAYVPNVSTNISPVLAKYGGYSQADLNSIFGNGVVSAGGTIGSCTRSDPLNGSDCVRQGSISIPNYVHGTWELEIANGSADYISVNEDIDTTVPPWKLDTSVNYVKYNPRQEWKRFATKVKVENKSSSSEVSLYSEQMRRMPSDPQNKGYKITLTNPFLTGLIGDDNFITGINMPEGVNCTNYQGLSGLTDIRGDEVSVVNLTFTTRPRKTLLNFYFNNLNTSDVLSPAQFDPNSGLIAGATTFDPIIGDNFFDYDRELNVKPQSDDEEEADDDLNSTIDIYYDQINSNFTTIFRNLTDFDINKKTKIYIKNSENWYSTSVNRGTGFFEHLGHKFAGKPNIFEYLDNEYNSSLYPSVFPSVSKTHKWFNADSIDGLIYPYLKRLNAEPEIGYRTNVIRFDGSRYYFQVFPDIIHVTFSIAEEDENGEEQILLPGTLEELLSGNIKGYYLPGESSDNGDSARTDYNLLLRNNYFIDIGNNTYKKINTKFDESSFLKIENQLDQRIFVSYNDVQINLQETEETGYVLNSSVECNVPVDFTYVASNGVERTTSNKIIKKELMWKFYDQEGFETNESNAVTLKLYTYFLLEKNLQYTNKLRMSFSDSSFIVYNDTPGLSKESSEYLNNSTFKTKWGDIIGYDNLVLDEFINDKAFFLDILYQPTYKNWFYKHFMNYLLRENGENLFFKEEYEEQDPQTHKLGTVDAMGTILQKYNLNDNLYQEDIALRNLQNYQNFIPVMDITIKQQIELGDYTSLNFTSSSLTTPYYSSAAEEPGDKFWIKVPKNVGSTLSYIPNDEYSPTLRIDGPFYQLYKTRKNFNYNKVGYRKVFLPSLTLIDIPENNVIGNKVSDSEYFKHFIVYGDKDIPKCEPQVDEDKRGFCLLDNIGSGFLYSDYVYNNTYGDRRTANLNKKLYLFSYDCGEYNPVGLPQLVTIKKSKLPADTYTSPLADNTTSYLKPFDVVPHVYDSRYQKDVEDYLVSNNSQDDNANEMLFRILYGSSDPINREFFGDSFIQPLSKIDLIDYSDPEIKPRDLYDQILFNYDKDASFSNFSYDATIAITGTLNIGFESTLTINDEQLKIKIEQDTKKNIIEAIVDFQGDEKGRKTLFETATTSYSYISVEAGSKAPSPPDDNTTIEQVKTIEYMPASTIRPFGRRFRTGDIAIRGTNVYKFGMLIGCQDIDPAIIDGRVFEAWDPFPIPPAIIDGQPVSRIPGGNNRSYDLGNGKTQTVTYNVSRIPVNNLLLGGDEGDDSGKSTPSGMQADLNLIPGPWRWSERQTSTESPSPPPDPELSYGYCRRQMDCDENGDDDKSIKENFVYEYEIGPYQFDLYGHAYLHTPLEEEEEEEEEVSPNICFNSVWSKGRRACIDYVSYANASEGNSPYGKFYYEMQQPRLDNSWPHPPKGPLGGINVRGDFVNCYEPQEYIDPNLNYIEPECVPFSDDTKWGLGYAIWKPLYGFYLPYGERWTTGVLHLKTMDPSTDEFWDFWEENQDYREDYENPYHFSNSLCADDATLTFLNSMYHSPVKVGSDGLTPQTKAILLQHFQNYDYQIAEWLFANGKTAPDYGTALNYGDEGVDYCGYYQSKVTMKDIDLYLRTTTEIKEYKPESGPIININITNSNITVTVQGQTICIDNKIDKCPEIDLPTDATYTINDSGCDKCDNSSLKIKLDNKSTYKTIVSTETHVIAFIEGTDLNDAFHNFQFVGFVNQEYHRVRIGYYDIGDGWFDVVCGETPGNPWYSHQRIIDADQMGVFDVKKNIWKQALEDLFKRDDYADTQADSNTGRIGAIDLSSQIPDIARIRRTKRGNAHIKESDILHGVVPDSISEIKFREVNTNYDKYRRLPGVALQVETGQGNLTSLEAYVEYKYVRPYTLKDAIKESRLGVTDDSFVNKAFDLEFPLWYGQSLGIGASNENILNRPPTRNYVVTAFNFGSDEETCHSFECSYNTDESIFYGGSPCPENDHYCWSISSWNGVR